MQQRDADDGHREVGRRAQRIAGEHAETAAIRGDRLVERDLHREVRDGGI